MAKVHVLGNRYIFHCPGCKCEHSFIVGGDGKSQWIFNGDLNKPTVSPSLVYANTPNSKQCHLFIKNGQIEYCDDCDHALKGKTVPMKDVR